MPRNPFTVLGVPLDATGDAIKAAWKRLARQNHPDVTSVDDGSERQANRTMAEINAAYQELRDPERRRAHRAAAAHEAYVSGAHEDTDGTEPVTAHRRPIYGTPHPTRPVTARIDTSALLWPRNAVLHPHERSPLPGLQPRPRSSAMREPPRASIPTGPTVIRQGPNLEADLPSLANALDMRLAFGKFAGYTLGDVAEIEPTYVDWIVRTIGRDPEITLAARVVLRELERSGWIRRSRYDAANQSGLGRQHAGSHGRDRADGGGARTPDPRHSNTGGSRSHASRPNTGDPKRPCRRPKT